MTDTQTIPAIIRLPQLLTRLGLFSTYTKAETAVKRGNIYIEINPDDPERSYFLRMDMVEGFVCIPNETRIKHINDDGEVSYTHVRPHDGRERRS